MHSHGTIVQPCQAVQLAAEQLLWYTHLHDDYRSIDAWDLLLEWGCTEDDVRGVFRLPTSVDEAVGCLVDPVSTAPSSPCWNRATPQREPQREQVLWPEVELEPWPEWDCEGDVVSQGDALDVPLTPSPGELSWAVSPVLSPGVRAVAKPRTQQTNPGKTPQDC